MKNQNERLLQINEDYAEKYGFHYPEEAVHRTKKDSGLTEAVVREISKIKNEPQWMLDKRLQALKWFEKKAMPTWGADLSHINFQNITYYLKPTEGQGRTWEEVPENIKKTFDRLGIPEAEKRFLGGVGAQYESESVYHKLQESLEKQGVVFLSMDDAVKQYPEIVKKYFGTIVPASDNKFAALNTACWSGGSFIYVPKGVKVTKPLQAYFRINAKNMGQFERTLIITDEGAEVFYEEGCTAPIYSTDSLHAAVVELVALKNSKLRYTTIQNWSSNVYNLVTKRAHAYENAVVEWIDLNLGSKITMKYPSVFLLEPHAKADILSIAFAGKGQHQDAGGKALHLAPHTTSRIISKSICKDGGRTSYRGLVEIVKGATDTASSVKCDALILDEKSRSDTYPTMKINEEDSTISHEAYVGKIGEEQLFYLRSRGFSESEATAMIVLGFIADVTKELPAEYSLELNNLIRLEMEGGVG
ncbi:MAG: Fe-S cluster assembly protein SufB [Candidatus Micrarchaeota archaeon]|nr:Fe-S cluster assembly protein SufB [Candidatus Micrarchaeota archaeon]